jgi:hypothetical protein
MGLRGTKITLCRQVLPVEASPGATLEVPLAAVSPGATLEVLPAAVSLGATWVLPAEVSLNATWVLPAEVSLCAMKALPLLLEAAAPAEATPRVTRSSITG